ncbi:MAG: hypothetical protein HQM08_20050 [Candidatus Riflebacteria bacterium]|nr:hypothetical protein [Candidatus Riflebacteria bacterium]
MKITKFAVIVGLAISTFGTPSYADDSNLIQSAMESKVCEDVLSNTKNTGNVSSLAAGLSEETRKLMVEKIKFAIVQENRVDLQKVLPDWQKLERSNPQLSSDNLLGLPLRPGKLEVSVLFFKRSGSIIRCDKENFQAVLDTVGVDVKPEPGKPGRVIAKFSGSSSSGNIPQDPIKGTISTSGNIANITGDDGTWVKVEYRSDGSYKFSSNKLPAPAVARYVD